METSEPAASPAPVTRPRARIRRIEAIVNPNSGSVGPDALERLEAIFAEFGVQSRITALEPGGFESALQSAVDAAPDLVVTLAGDGTATRAAVLCGADGPVLAPLPGGTMNFLPRALYGGRAWPEALVAALEDGEQRDVSGGEVNGHRFHCAAILGSPALWAPAREAVRAGDLRRAFDHAVHAFQQAFSTRLRFQIGVGQRRRGVALSLICPLVSRAASDDHALEAAVLNPKDAGEVFRLGLYDIFSDWRLDPAVTVWPCVQGSAWARHSIPCLVDGEKYDLGRTVSIAFRPKSFRGLFAPPEIAEPIEGPGP